MDYTKITDQFRQDFFKLTDEAKSICLTSHISYDEDAIASMLAAYRLLKDKYPRKKIEIIYTGEPTNRYQTFQNFEKINFVPDLAAYLQNYEVVLMLDGSQYHRFTVEPARLKEFRGKKICIDHHNSPVDEFDLSLIVPLASSTTELIYLSFYSPSLKVDSPSEAFLPLGASAKWGAKEGVFFPQVDKPLAEIFLLGILGDTGNFTYLRPYQTETLITVKKLVEAGQIEIAELLARYRSIEPKILKVLEELIKNTEFHQINNWPLFQSSFLERQFIEENRLTDKEVSEAGALYIAYYVRSITGYSWGFVVLPKASGRCDVSFRSLPIGVNVRELAERMGLGSGHDQAAGGSFKERDKVFDALECRERILGWLKQNQPILS